MGNEQAIFFYINSLLTSTGTLVIKDRCGRPGVQDVSLVLVVACCDAVQQ